MSRQGATYQRAVCLRTQSLHPLHLYPLHLYALYPCFWQISGHERRYLLLRVLPVV